MNALQWITLLLAIIEVVSDESSEIPRPVYGGHLLIEGEHDWTRIDVGANARKIKEVNTYKAFIDFIIRIHSTD